MANPKNKGTIDETKLVTEAYQPIAEAFNKTRRNLWDWIKKFLKEEVKDGFYYDIGCGGGRLLNDNSIGVDSCQKFVDIVLEKKLNAVLADMTQLPFKSETADNILSIASFHHLSTPKRRLQALKEMYRVLKPGGKILLSVWSINQPRDTETKRKFSDYGDVIVPWKKNKKGGGTEVICERYYYIFQLDEIRSLFQEVGFTEVSHEWNYGNEIFVLEKPNP